MKSFVLCVVTLLIGIYVFQVDCTTRKKSHCHKKCCPKYGVMTTNFSDPVQIADSQLKLVESLWNNTSPTLTAKGKKFKEAMLFMAKSDVPRWNIVATIASAWIWTILPQYKAKPNYCGFGKMIEMSVLPRNDTNYCAKLNDALLGVNEYLAGMQTYILSTSMKSAGCCTPKIPVSTPSCSARDSLAAAKELWRQKGNSYPCIYQSAALSAYKSCNYLDQIIGVLGKATLSDHLNNYFMSFEVKGMYQSFQLQAVGKIPKRCCNSLKAELAESYQGSLGPINASTIYVKQQAGCPIE